MYLLTFDNPSFIFMARRVRSSNVRKMKITFNLFLMSEKSQFNHGAIKKLLFSICVMAQHSLVKKKTLGEPKSPIWPIIKLKTSFKSVYFKA